MRHEWDASKDRANQAKHGVSFATAALVFEDPRQLSVQDRHEGGEERWQTLGQVGGIVILMVAHTHREDEQGEEIIRIISARKASAARGNTMSKKTEHRTQREIARLSKLDEDSIDTRDIPEVSDWSGAERSRFYRPVKQQITLRIDADVLAWFRAHNRRYQTGINAALRDYVEHQSKTG